MKVAHVITDLTTGGAEMMLLRLLEKHDRSRYPSEVISLKQTRPVGDKISALGVPVRALHMGKLPGPGQLLKLASWLRAGRFDVVQTWMTHADLIGGLAASVARIPVAWGLHVGHLDRATHGRAALVTAQLNARLSSRVPRAIVCCSETSRVEHERLGFRPEKMRVIPNGFDLDRFRPDAEARADVRRELGLPADALVLGHVGRFHPQKDHATLIAAAAGVLARHPEARVVLIGRDTVPGNPQLEALLERTAFRDRFCVLGPRDDLPRLTAAFDLALSSSSYGEAFPLVIGEAMACEVPCAVTDCGDSARMVAETGRVAPIRDPARLASAIEELIALGPGGRAQLGQAARRRVAQLYALDDIVARYHRLYDEIAAG